MQPVMREPLRTLRSMPRHGGGACGNSKRSGFCAWAGGVRRTAILSLLQQELLLGNVGAIQEHHVIDAKCAVVGEGQP